MGGMLARGGSRMSHPCPMAAAFPGSSLTSEKGWSLLVFLQSPTQCPVWNPNPPGGSQHSPCTPPQSYTGSGAAALRHIWPWGRCSWCTGFKEPLPGRETVSLDLWFFCSLMELVPGLHIQCWALIWVLELDCFHCSHTAGVSSVFLALA